MSITTLSCNNGTSLYVQALKNFYTIPEPHTCYVGVTALQEVVTGFLCEDGTLMLFVDDRPNFVEWSKAILAKETPTVSHPGLDEWDLDEEDYELLSDGTINVQSSVSIY